MDNNQQSIKLSLLFFFTLIFNVFFWEEDLGLNLFLFNSFILAAISYIYRENLPNNRLAYLLIGGTILTSLAILYHNTLNSKIAWILSFSATVAAIQNNSLKLLPNTWSFFLLNLFSSFANLPAELLGIFKKVSNRSDNMKKINRKAGLLAIPIVIFSVFYMIFNIANPVFAEYNSKALDLVVQFFDSLFANISFGRMLFILFGLWLVSAIIYRWHNIDETFNEMKIKGTDFIIRSRIIRNRNYYADFKSLDLKNEAQIAFLVVASVNLLLLVINAIDIRFLWFGFHPSAGVKLSQLVHEGTYMLILSILLSMAILLYYFRNNLNFYSKNVLLKKMAIVWLVQNGILLISVLFRCYYYIAEHGLAYKRIGVILFLLLTLVGLVTFYNKIKNKKSAYYLIHINSLAAYILLIITTFINWDNLIVSYNFQHPNLKITGAIDIAFTLSRSESTLTIIYANMNKIDMELQEINEYYFYQEKGKIVSRKQYVEKRKKEFFQHYKEISWLSWNFSSAKVYEILK